MNADTFKQAYEEIMLKKNRKIEKRKNKYETKMKTVQSARFIYL